MTDLIAYTLHKIAKNLENNTSCSFRKEETMPLNKKKIRREISINGVKMWITADTEQEYVDKILSVAGARKDATYKHPFKEYADRWFEVFSKPNVAEVTASTYKRQLENHIYPILGRLNLEDISPSDVQRIFNTMGERAKQETKNKTKNVLNQIFKMAVEDNFIARNPLDSSSVKIKGQPSSVTEPYSVDQMRFLASHIGLIRSTTDRAWLALSISLPLRPEEVLGLTWNDVDLEQCVIHVRNTVTHPNRNEPFFKPYTKTLSSIRDLAFPREILQYLPEQGAPDEFVIGGDTPVSYTKLRGICKRVNFDTGFGETITPRRFRTTVATDISAMTHDLKLVQQMLGHSNPQMTLKHYDKGRSNAVDASDAISKAYGLTSC